MKTACILFIVVISFTSFSQSNDSIFFNFDLIEYNKLKELDKNHYFKEDSTKVTLAEDKEVYQLVVTPNKSPYSTTYQYFKTTLTLKSSGSYFKRNPIGWQNKYDEKGILISEYKADSAFTYTLQELNERLINEYHIEILNVKKGISVSMQTSFQPIYTIAYNTTDNSHGIWRFLQFDGVTGEKLNDFEKANECKAR